MLVSRDALRKLLCSLLFVSFVLSSPSPNSLLAQAPSRLSPRPVFGVSPNGISPQALAKPISELTGITSAYYNPENGELVIIGTKEKGLPPLKFDDFIVALRAMYSGEYPAVSIDPGTNPKAMDAKYWGQTENTHFGLVMFEADRLLKVLSMGRDNVTNRIVRSDVPGFQTYLHRATSNYSASKQSSAWFRMWFEPKESTLQTSSDKRSVRLDSLSMAVRTEFLPPNVGIDPNAQDFVEHINQNYDRYVREQPVLHELVQLEQWLVLAKWMRDTDGTGRLRILGKLFSPISQDPC